MKLRGESCWKLRVLDSTHDCDFNLFVVEHSRLRRIKNGGGGWTHPVHIHLVDSHIVRRIDGERVRWVSEQKKWQG